MLRERCMIVLSLFWLECIIQYVVCRGLISMKWPLSSFISGVQTSNSPWRGGRWQCYAWSGEANTGRQTGCRQSGQGKGIGDVKYWYLKSLEETNQHVCLCSLIKVFTVCCNSLASESIYLLFSSQVCDHFHQILALVNNSSKPVLINITQCPFGRLDIFCQCMIRFYSTEVKSYSIIS